MIIRKTTKCPNSGNTRTKIWNKLLFSNKLLYDYGFELIENRTIGVKENHLLASVPYEYGQSLGYSYYYKNYLK